MRQPPTFSSIADAHTIQIRAEKSGCVTSFLLFWLSGWLLGGGFAIRALGLGLAIGPPGMGSPSRFLLTWLGFWLVGLLVFGYQFVWQLAGKEVITLAGGVLRIRQQAGPLGTTQSYDSQYIHSLHAQPDAWPTTLSNSQRSDWAAGSVVFGYKSKTIRFGAMLPEAEARRIVAFLREQRVGGL